MDGTKGFKLIEEPKMTYYVTKPECDDMAIHNRMPIDDVFPVTCKYNALLASMDKSIGDPEFSKKMKDAFKSGYVYQALKDLHLDRRFHGTDMDIADFYIDTFLRNYPQDEPELKNNFGITKCFFDIEVDSSNIIGFPDPSEAKCPVNVVSLFDMNNANMYVFCRKYEHDGYIDVFNDIAKYIEEIKDRYKYIEEKIGKEINFIINEYDDELELIKSFFDVVNEEIRPDFLCAWNISFDFLTLYNRILRLGGDPNEIISANDFPYKYASYYLDIKNYDPSERSESYKVCSYTVYIDLMCLYASLTKMNGKMESYSLDYIGEHEVGIHKDELDGTNIRTAHFDNYKTFLTYNIQDTMMLMLIENKTKHLDAIYSLSIMTRTRIDKTLKKTISIRNYASLFYRKNGYVISNNRSELYPKTGEKIRGAFVADPNLIDNVGFKITYNPSSKIFELAIDFDLSSLYPSIIIAYNISPETCYYKITMKDLDGNDVTDIFMDDLISNDYINFGNKWYGLPNISEMYRLLTS